MKIRLLISGERVIGLFSGEKDLEIGKKFLFELCVVLKVKSDSLFCWHNGRNPEKRRRVCKRFSKDLKDGKNKGNGKEYRRKPRKDRTGNGSPLARKRER